jgi:excisionase family DNA binding protein
VGPRKGEKGSGRPHLPRPEPAPEASLDEPREVMTLREVAEYLNCHYSTVLRLLRDGDFPAFRLVGGGELPMPTLRPREVDRETGAADRKWAQGS